MAAISLTASSMHDGSRGSIDRASIVRASSWATICISPNCTSKHNFCLTI